MGIEIIILVVLIILNALFAGSEMALVSINDNKIKIMAENGDQKAKLVYRLLEEPSRFLATIQIGITLSGLMASAFAARSFVEIVSRQLYSSLTIPLEKSLLDMISTIFITLILSYFTLVIGELVPKRLAAEKPEKVSFLVAPSLLLLSKITSPCVKLLTGSTNVIVRLFGVDPHYEEEDVTEEEIRMMVDMGQERGTIQETEKEMINNIFEFDNKMVSDIMTHRTNIVAISVDKTYEEIIHIVNLKKLSRIPVYEENIDYIVGVLHVKDLFHFIENEEKESFNLNALIRKPHYVLDSVQIDYLFKDMQRNNVQFAIAIDEYGGTEGIVTMEDILEEIVGKIFDEYDDPAMDIEDIEVIDEVTYVMAGTTFLEDVEEALKIQLPTEDYDTLSGFIIGELGYIPSLEERPTVEYENFTFHIEEINDRRIVKVKVTRNIEENGLE